MPPKPFNLSAADMAKLLAKAMNSPANEKPYNVSERQMWRLRKNGATKKQVEAEVRTPPQMSNSMSSVIAFLIMFPAFVFYAW